MNILEIEVSYNDIGTYQLFINLPDEIAAKKILGFELSSLAKFLMSLAFTLLNLKVDIVIK